MTAISPDPDDPGEAAQLAGLAHLMQLAEDLVSARDTVVLPVLPQDFGRDGNQFAVLDAGMSAGAGRR